MISLLIIRPTTCDSDIKGQPPKRVDRELVPRNSQTVDDLNRNEEMYVFRLFTWYFVLLILSAILALHYIGLNPDAFMMDITPKTDLGQTLSNR